jgi:putative flavoprotein involved in K+ transport
MSQTLDHPALGPTAEAAPDLAAARRDGTSAPTAQERAEAWLAAFEAALGRADAEEVAGLFATACFWRDLVAFTWNITTAEGREEVAERVRATAARTGASGFATSEPATDASAPDGRPTVEAWITFETAVGRGKGLLRLVHEDDGDGPGRDVAWTLLTTLFELKGFEEPQDGRRPRGAEHGVHRGRSSWRERRDASVEGWGGERQPYVLVVGGGQGGIALGARLRHLDVPTLVVDAHERPGDQWRGRYKSLCLHDPVWYDHLPYLPFPRSWPVFAPKDKIGDWLEMYVKVMEVDYWGSTRVVSARRDDDAGTWEVHLERRRPGTDGAEDDVEHVVLHPTELVLATGMSGKPNVPSFPGAERFRGDQHHSSAHPGPDAYRGKKAVIIGANNSAHDIAAALWENGAEVTVVQRSSTHVVRSDSLMEVGLGALYSEEALAAGVTTEKADLVFASLPYRIMHEFQIPLYEEIARRDADFYERLEKAGFWLDWGDDGSGLFMKYLRRGSGYYIDVGASELFADGSVTVVHEPVRELVEDAVVLDDGTPEGRRLPADLVVYATGYGSMNGWAADLISPEVADRVGKVWGLGSDTTKDPGPWEGEQRNMWKPTQQEGLWMHGGNLHQSRHYSLYLALQLKARSEGLDTPVHALAPVHHTR